MGILALPIATRPPVEQPNRQCRKVPQPPGLASPELRRRVRAGIVRIHVPNQRPESTSRTTSRATSESVRVCMKTHGPRVFCSPLGAH